MNEVWLLVAGLDGLVSVDLVEGSLDHAVDEEESNQEPEEQHEPVEEVSKVLSVSVSDSNRGILSPEQASPVVEWEHEGDEEHEEEGLDAVVGLAHESGLATDELHDSPGEDEDGQDDLLVEGDVDEHEEVVSWGVEYGGVDWDSPSEVVVVHIGHPF